MFGYQNAAICFVHLAQYWSDQCPVTARHLRECKWFRRGWTLQELLAPHNLCFCDSQWRIFGHMLEAHWKWWKLEGKVPFGDLDKVIKKVTSIPADCMRSSITKDWPTVALKMSWASRRETSREEDEAYSLLGTFGVNMPLLYGEGDRVFSRLREEIIRQSSDSTVFA